MCQEKTQQLLHIHTTILLLVYSVGIETEWTMTSINGNTDRSSFKYLDLQIGDITRYNVVIFTDHNTTSSIMILACGILHERGGEGNRSFIITHRACIMYGYVASVGRHFPSRSHSKALSDSPPSQPLFPWPQEQSTNACSLKATSLPV